VQKQSIIDKYLAKLLALIDSKKKKDQEHDDLVNFSNTQTPEFNIFFLAIIGTIIVVISFIILLVVRSKRKSRINEDNDDNFELSQKSPTVKLQRTKSRLLAREALDMSLKMKLRKSENFKKEKESSSEKLDKDEKSSSEKLDKDEKSSSEKLESEKQSSKSKKQSKSESSNWFLFVFLLL